MAKIKPRDYEKCIQCEQIFTEKEIEKGEFYYSRTKRKTTMFVHRECWNDVLKYKGGVVI